MRGIAKLIAVAVSCTTIGCSSSGGAATEIDSQVVDNNQYVVAPATPPPGVVQYCWEEPMVDVVEVPAGLDPQGVYYRPQHQQVVEIRQGRWRYQDQ